MRKTCISHIFILFFTWHFVQAQRQLWGLTGSSGSNTSVIFKTDSCGNNYQLVHEFVENKGNYSQYNKFLKANNGKLYTISEGAGGVTYAGALIEYDPISNKYLTKHYFTVQSNSSTRGGLVQALNGKLYGVIMSGGTNNSGIIFEYDISGDIYTKLHDFTQVTGSMPTTNFLLASNGKIYGLTRSGGVNNKGVLYEYDIINKTYSAKVDFDGILKGDQPQQGNMVEANNGKIYGTTYFGGLNSSGVLFEYDPLTGNFIKKYDFNNNNGVYPSSSILSSSSGLLYGVASSGGATYGQGTMFKYDTKTSVFNKIIDFHDTLGVFPEGGLAEDINGNIYGTTRDGGKYGNGILFKYDTLTKNFTKIIDFKDTLTGKHPSCTLTEYPNGKFYGTTGAGGLYNTGVVFEFDPILKTLTKKIDLNSTINGNIAPGSLMQASNGKLYGLTSAGGNNRYGILFEFDPSSLTFIKKFDFSDSSGRRPNGSLIQASNGKLYGMTLGGGKNSKGTLFEFDINNDTISKKIDFDGITAGFPYGSLLEGGNNKLYGMTTQGGTINKGVIFEYDILMNKLIKKIDFNGLGNGSNPLGELILSTNGKMYGMTAYGGINNAGTLFEYDYINNVLTKKNDFDGVNKGSVPNGSLYEATNGKLYGLTPGGGINSNGVIFEYNPSTGAFLKLFDFNNLVSGSNPNGSLMESSCGKLYGMSSFGAAYNFGAFFEFDTLTKIFSKKFDFDGTNGGAPYYTHLIEVCNTPSVPICSIVLDSVNYTNNIIIWGKAGISKVDSFVIYRSQSTTGFQKINSQAYSTYSTYTDLGVSQANGPYYYKLTSKSYCGESSMGLWHKPIFLQYNGNGNFSWSPYQIENTQNPSISNYEIYKDSSGNGQLLLYATVNPNQNFYTDVNYLLTPNARYLVITTWNNSCNPTFKLPNGANRLMSNIATQNGPLSIKEITPNIILNIFPNPATDQFSINLTNNKIQTVNIYNLVGEMVSQINTTESNLTVSAKNFPNGVYLIEVKNQLEVIGRKIIIINR